MSAKPFIHNYIALKYPHIYNYIHTKIYIHIHTNINNIYKRNSSDVKAKKQKKIIL